MADRDHPKTHVEDDKDAKLPRTQPLSPIGEGIDPLTEGDTMYPPENVKEASTFDKAPSQDEKQANKSAEKTVSDQEERDAVANTPDSQLPDDEKTTSPDASPAGDTPPADSPESTPGTSPSNETDSKKS